MLDELIAEGQKSLEEREGEPMHLRKLALLKVFRKKLDDQREIKVQPDAFKDQNSILHYSWQLFKDKLNSKVHMLTDKTNPKVEFNLIKYFEYTYGSPFEEVKKPTKKEVKEILLYRE